MPIKNYEKDAERLEHQVLNNIPQDNPQWKPLSEANIASLKRYLMAYDVRPATKVKFLKQIPLLLRKLDDIEKDMVNRDKINRIFKQLSAELSPAYLNTLKNVSNAFVRWLNDGDKPIGFKDIKNTSKKDMKRNLDPSDMWLWQDGLSACETSTSIQLKAILMTQLDAGMRPSEFVDLNYGSVKVSKDIVTFMIKSGKTGSRPVPCHRSAPYFLRWYHNHPSKKPEDPLWVLENNSKSHRKTGKVEGIVRFPYDAMRKRISQMANKSGITDKPCDFYNLRHSSCVLDKMDNLPLELAASRHGHSVGFFTQIYGRLDVEGIAERMRLHYGGTKVENKLKPNRVCERCHHINKPDDEFCYGCAAPLTLTSAMKLKDEQEQVNHQMQEQIDSTKEEMIEIKKLLLLQNANMKKG